jgi:hypothetical protein
MMLPGALQYQGKLKERADVMCCVDGTASVCLPSSRKLVFLRHRRFLQKKHKYHKWKGHFDNMVEKDSALKRYTGKLLFEMVKNIQVVFRKRTVKGQKRKKT